jgi:hypothetical protein
LEGGKERPYFLINTQKGFYSAYPIITGLMALPIHFIPLMLNKIPELTYHENILKVFLLGRISASFYASLSVLLFYFILKKVRGTDKNEAWILLFSLFYAFGTNTWSVASRGMWQHTTSQFLISVALLLLLYAETKPKVIPWIGFVLGITVLTRPTNIILAAVISGFIAVKYKKHLGKYIAAVIPSIIFMFLYNYLTFGSPFVEGYGARNDFAWSTSLWESVPGYAVSPARSFLFISPSLVLGYYAIYKAFASKKFGGKFNLLYKYLGIGFLGSLVMFAKWYTWDGANAFGYRMLLDFIPIVGLLAFEITKNLGKKGRLVVILLILYSIYVHSNAVFFRKGRCSRDHNWSFYCLMPPKEMPKY